VSSPVRFAKIKPLDLADEGLGQWLVEQVASLR
jgi:hypothetical protein